MRCVLLGRAREGALARIEGAPNSFICQPDELVIPTVTKSARAQHGRHFGSYRQPRRRTSIATRVVGFEADVAEAEAQTEWLGAQSEGVDGELQCRELRERGQ